MNEKWDELSYELTADAKTRSLTIVPHFQKISTGWFDTGQYTISENGKPIGKIYVDYYTNQGIQWDGSKDTFTSHQLREIVNNIPQTY